MQSASAKLVIFSEAPHEVRGKIIGQGERMRFALAVTLPHIVAARMVQEDNGARAMKQATQPKRVGATGVAERAA